MPRCTRIKLNKGIVESLEADGQDRLYWDSELPAFGLRVHPSGSKSYFVDYYSDGKRGRMSLGAHGVLTCDEARRRAREILVGAEKGVDPLEERREARRGMSLAEFWREVYFPDAAARWKKTTRYETERIWRVEIEPRLGTRRLDAIRPADLAKLHRSMKDRPGLANLCLRILRAVFIKAVQLQAIPGTPLVGIRPFPLKKRERFLNAAEIAVLFRALSEEENFWTVGGKPRAGESSGRGGRGMKETESRGISPSAASLFRLLCYTGARLREIMLARWDWVNWTDRTLELPDSKTGPKRIPLAQPVIDELQRLYAARSQNAWIIEGGIAGKPFTAPVRPWLRVCARANAIWNEERRKNKLDPQEPGPFSGLRIHDLRHNAASVGVAAGLPLFSIGKVLGHKNASTTEKYSHLALDPIQPAAEVIAARIQEAVTAPQARLLDVPMKKAEGGTQ